MPSLYLYNKYLKNQPPHIFPFNFIRLKMFKWKRLNMYLNNLLYKSRECLHLGEELYSSSFAQSKYTSSWLTPDFRHICLNIFVCVPLAYIRIPSKKKLARLTQVFVCIHSTLFLSWFFLLLFWMIFKCFRAWALFCPPPPPLRHRHASALFCHLSLWLS